MTTKTGWVVAMFRGLPLALGGLLLVPGLVTPAAGGILSGPALAPATAPTVAPATADAATPAAAQVSLSGTSAVTTPAAAPAAVPPSQLPGAASNAASPSPDQDPEVVVTAPEPKYVAPTLRDRIGRIWAPVLINGKGPFRLVLDTGASRSAVISRVASSLGIDSGNASSILVRGVTGSAVVPAIHVDRMEVGELLISPTNLPIVADVFGGAEGVLGREGLPDKRIFADFGHDRLVITRSHREHADPGFVIVPLKMIRSGLLTAEIRVGPIRTTAIIDTGAQQTVGNGALREALMKHRSKDSVPEEIIGVTLDEQHGDTMPAPPMAIGTLEIHQARVTFSDMYLFDHLDLTREPTLFLGMDVLGSFDILIIDYRLRELQIRTRDNRST